MRINTCNVVGFRAALWGVRLSYQTKEQENLSNVRDSLDILFAKDIELARRLVEQGPDHSKFMRMVQVWAAITAPRYWWCQFDTYKIGTTACSASTMHTIMKRSLDQCDFESPVNVSHLSWLNEQILAKNFEIVKANLPEGFLQTRMVNMNYQTIRTIVQQRKTHKLKEWTYFCRWAEGLPHGDLIIRVNPHSESVPMVEP